MKSELRRIVTVFQTEIRIASSMASAIARQRKVLAIGLLALFVAFANKDLAEARYSPWWSSSSSSSSSSELPFLRGGSDALSYASSSSAAANIQKPLLEKIKRNFGPALLNLAIANLQRADAIGAKIQSETVKHWNGLGENVAREWCKVASNFPSLIDSTANNLQRINAIGAKMQSETVKQWNGLGDNVAREWAKLTGVLGKVLSKRRPQSSSEGTGKLDEVLRTFRSVLDGNSGEMDAARLLRACRAHLVLMKSGGPALRVVARDMENNLVKAESLLSRLPPDVGRRLSSLLEWERDSGMHDGSKLRDASAAMGLLWIRRSLAFQSELYASLLVPSADSTPRDAALDAYYEQLSPYHGWMLRKVFPLSLSQLPDRDVFIAKFGGKDSAEELDERMERDIVKKIGLLVAMWEPIIDTWKYEFERLDLEDTRQA